MPIQPLSTGETVSPDAMRKRVSRAAERMKVSTDNKEIWIHRIVAALPIIAVNVVAVTMQLVWAHTALRSWGQTGAILYAVSVETLALSVSYHAHRAMIRNLRSGGLKAASILLGTLVGVLNASHWIHHSIPLACVAFGASFISPLLWHVYSNSVSSEILAKNGLLDYHGVRLGPDRWIFHPIRSFIVKRNSVWLGENNVSVAIRTYNQQQAEKAARKAIEQSTNNLDAEIKEIAS
jgi:hypothetical protein